MDFSASSIAAARKQFGATDTEFVEADAGNMPLPDSSCDVVLSHMVLHIMNPVEPSLSEVSRVLKPNGTLHVCIPAHWCMNSSAEAGGLQDVLNLFPQFKEVSTPTRVGTGKFATEQSISDTITSGFSGKITVSFTYADLMTHRPPTEALNPFTCGMYPFDLILDKHKPEAAKTFLTKLIALKDGDGIVRLRRPMAIVSVIKA